MRVFVLGMDCVGAWIWVFHNNAGVSLLLHPFLQCDHRKVVTLSCSFFFFSSVRWKKNSGPNHRILLNIDVIHVGWAVVCL